MCQMRIMMVTRVTIKASDCIKPSYFGLENYQVFVWLAVRRWRKFMALVNTFFLYSMESVMDSIILERHNR